MPLPKTACVRSRGLPSWPANTVMGHCVRFMPPSTSSSTGSVAIVHLHTMLSLLLKDDLSLRYLYLKTHKENYCFPPEQEDGLVVGVELVCVQDGVVCMHLVGLMFACRLC